MMFYLINCDVDHSYCIVEDENVISDPECILQIKDHVQFFWGKDKLTGTVEDFSENADTLKKLAKETNCKRKKLDSSSTSPLPKKRLRIPKKVWSFENNLEDTQLLSGNKSDKSKAKILENKSSTTVQKQVKEFIDKKKINVSKDHCNKYFQVEQHTEISPTMEELKRIIEEKNQLLALVPSLSSQKNVSVREKTETSADNDDAYKSDSQSSFNTSEDEDNEQKKLTTVLVDKMDPKNKSSGIIEIQENVHPQLYGKNSGEPMILLKDGIYCKKSTYDDAVDISRKSATSFMRRILNGVFKRNAILNCTYSGQSPRAQGREKQYKKYEALDRSAKKVVIEFCDEYARKNNWTIPTKTQLSNAISQWLGEVKREHQKNIEKNYGIML